MRKIYKYPLNVTDEQTIALGASAKPISAGLDPKGTLCLWAEVTPNVRAATLCEVRIVGTGNPITFNTEEYHLLGSVNQGSFIWHVYCSRVW